MSLRSILIVEPNPGILIVGRNVLARAGFVVAAAATVEEGLAHAKRRAPDVVLLDGRWSEPEVLIAFARAKPRGVPIVLTVQKGRDVITIEALEAGGWSELVEIADVIEKPFAPDLLLAAVEKALARVAERTDPRLVLDPELALLRVDDAEESERTDRFEKTPPPFEALLESVASRAASSSHGDADRTALVRELTSPIGERDSDVGVISTKFARLAAKLQAALTEERIQLEPRQIIALAQACAAALDGESFEETEPEAQGDLALEGHIQHLAIDQILQLATSVAQPSRCRLEHEGQAIEIFFRGGQVVFARQMNMPEGFTLGRLIVAAGVAEQHEVERSIAARSRSGSGRWIGQRLLGLGIIGERELKSALRRQVEELVFEAVRWTSGKFSVFAKEPLPPAAEDAAVSLPVQHLLLEGMRRLDEWRRMARDVGDLRSVIDRLEITDAANVIQSLRPEERALLEHVDGRRTVEDLVKSVRRPTFDVFKALHGLRGRRLVTVIEPGAPA